MDIQYTLNQNKNLIREMLDNGKSYSFIAKVFNINSGNIYCFCQKNGMKSNNKRSENHGKLHIYKEYIRQQLENKISLNIISKNIGFKVSSVSKFVKVYFPNIKIETSFNLDYLLKDNIEEILLMFDNGLDLKSICKNTGFSYASIWNVLNNNNRNTERVVYNVDESFFEKIDTQEKAYCLGFWYSDGNVSLKNGILRISIAESDLEILEKISKCLKFEGSINKRIVNKKNCQNLVELNICRKKMVLDLINKGCFPNKSLTLKFPGLEIIPNNLLNHFIRGYFDGDGGINKYTTHFTGSYNFITELKNYLPCQITGIYQRYKDKEPNLSAHSLQISRKEESLKCLNFIYKDATIYLDRKYKKYLEIKNTYH